MDDFRLNPTQRAWFRQASDAERRVFMAKGPVTHVTLGNLTLRTTREGFKIRGVNCTPDESDFKTAGEALAAGELLRQRFAAEATTVVDEEALGLSNDLQLAAHTGDEWTLRCDVLIPLSMAVSDGVVSEALRDMVESVDDAQVDRLVEASEFFSMLKGPFDGRDDLAEAVSDMVCLRGVTGFLGQFARPVMYGRPESDRTISHRQFSWGSYHTEWIYGDTFKQLQERAAKWAERIEAEDDAECLKTHGQPA